jgi:hypothetical protein
MSTVPLFKNRNGSVTVVGVKGSMFRFMGGRLYSTIPSEIAELTAMAEEGASGVYIDTNETDIDPKAASPMEVMRKKIISEYLAAQNVPVNAGTSEMTIQMAQASAMSTADNQLQDNSFADKVADPVKGDALDSLKKLTAGKS